ncbi:HNH endonuclease isoform X2 [Tasmannia lanceolata]|uniref:HNH endonuclease isoform X2 n=1 Tax=Tasmannia lanceolata TaxID=3420 RepID=UPI0040642A37
MGNIKAPSSRWKLPCERTLVGQHSMAKFTVQGGLKLLFNGERVSFSFDPRDPFPCRVSGLRFLYNPIQIHKNKVRVSRFGRVCSVVKSSSSSNPGECLHDVAIDDDDDDAFENDELSYFKGLVLDISYRPVNVVCWKRAICLEFMEKADVLEYYDQTVSSPRGSFYIPAVLRVPHLLQVVKRRRIKNHLSRKNIFFRDHFTCQYCSSRENLTIDHIFPISRGGKWKWENLVTACSICNSKKGQKTLEEANMKIIKVPKAPKDFDILAIPLTSTAIKMLKMRKGMPNEWRQYLSKSSSDH